MFQQRRAQPKQESEDCEIEVKQTKTGKKIRFKGKCTKQQMEVLASQSDIDLE